MAENTRKVWEKLKESSKGSTILGKTVKNPKLVKMYFQYKQTSRVDLTWKSFTVHFIDHTLPCKKIDYNLAMTFMISKKRIIE